MQHSAIIFLNLIFLIGFSELACSFQLRQHKFLQRNDFRMTFTTHYEELPVDTLRDIGLADITKQIQAIVDKSQVQEGIVTALSKHSTVSVTINEMESCLVDDTRQFLLKLAPPY